MNAVSVKQMEKFPYNFAEIPEVMWLAQHLKDSPDQLGKRNDMVDEDYLYMAIYVFLCGQVRDADA